MKKILAVLLAALLFAGIVGAGSATFAESVSQTNNDFNEPISDSSEKSVVIEDAEAESGSVSSVSIILFAVGGAAVLGLVAAFVVWNIKSKQENKKAIRYVFQMFSVAAIAVLLIGNGAAGFHYSAQDSGNTYYNGTYEASESSAPDPVKGYTESLINRKVLATFENGLDRTYGKSGARSSHYWTSDAPTYTEQEPDEELVRYRESEGLADNYNSWKAISGAGKCYAEYRFTYRGVDNFEHTTLYNRLRLVYCAEGKGTVNLTVYADTRRGDDPILYDLGTIEVEAGSKKEITLNLGVIADEDRAYLDRLRFETDCTEIDGIVEHRLYYIEMYSTGSARRDGIEIGNLKIDSEFLGSTQYMMYGAYSPSGFYDTSDGKWKVWFGAGIPEGIASDNVYYAETTDPRMGWSQPIRLVLDDPTNKLYSYNRSPGYGGDPGVIKVDGTYYMYFSGLEKSAVAVGGGHWNKIYLATSQDGLNFTVQKAVVDVPNGGTLGYGAGSPSVVYKDGKFYLYFYTQTPVGKNNVQGVVRSVSSDPMNFTEFEACVNTSGAIDVKWMPTLNLWVATDYTEGGDVNNVRVGYSTNGLSFIWGNSEEQRPAQPFYEPDIHNPGWLGTEEGFGYETMFLLYGTNDMDLRHVQGGAQMDSRQMEWSRVTFSSTAAQTSLQSAENSGAKAAPLSAAAGNSMLAVQTNLDLKEGGSGGAAEAVTIVVNVLGGLLAVGAVVTGILCAVGKGKAQQGKPARNDEGDKQ